MLVFAASVELKLGVLIDLRWPKVLFHTRKKRKNMPEFLNITADKQQIRVIASAASSQHRTKVQEC